MRNNFTVILFLFLNTLNIPQTKFFVKFKDKTPSELITNTIHSLNNSFSLSKRDTFESKGFLANFVEPDNPLAKIFIINFSNNVAATNLDKIKNNFPEIEYIQPVHSFHIDYTPNDEKINQQWALTKINAFFAWDITRGSDTVLIGLIDTGIDYLHPDLQNKIFVNMAEDINANGKLDTGDLDNIDNDHNGFVDDVIGWDFTNREEYPYSPYQDNLQWDNDPADEHGHGTSVAGIIAAETNNTIGIAGTAPDIKILNLRTFDYTGNSDEDDVAAAIVYSVKMGVKVINMSFGDNSYSYLLRDVIKYAYQKGVVLVASAGNSASNDPHYPSAFDEVISVGASTREDYIASFSNTGSTLDLVAPGSEILTTSRNNTYNEISGTSAATPFVSAAAALILSVKNFLPDEVKGILKSAADDIATPGWDEKSGAGRLNIYKALQTLAPSVIKFNSPYQDYSTSGDSLVISATVLSSSFQNFTLSYGMGFNPQQWNILIEKNEYQVSNKNLYTLNLLNLPDTVYCLRLMVNMHNGETSEERINFYADKSKPELTLHSLKNAFYKGTPVILSEVITDEPCIVRMYYRQKGRAEFESLVMDGFQVNNKFLKQNHFGFTPAGYLFPEAKYDIYFEAENTAGLKSVLKDHDQYFTIEPPREFSLISFSEKPFSLPPGVIFKDPVNFTNNNFREVMLQESGTSGLLTNTYLLDNDSFVKIDSSFTKYPRDFGDFNKDGKWDLLSSLGRFGYIDEQSDVSSATLINKYSDTTGSFYPILAEDLDGDGKTEILSIKGENKVAVWEIESDLKIHLERELENFSEKESDNEFSNIFNNANAAIADCNNDGKKEIWLVDGDGDLVSYIINGPDNYSPGDVINTSYSGNSVVCAGDYDTNGTVNLAVLFVSSEFSNIAPVNRVVIFSKINNEYSTDLNQVFISPDVSQGLSFSGKNNSIRFADIDSFAGDEIIIYSYPDAYILSHTANNIFIFYKSNVNSPSIFIGDLNSNGVKEIAFPQDDRISFYEFSKSHLPPVPYNLSGYNLDSTSIKLTWSGYGSKYFIYRGANKNNINLIDSTDQKIFVDKNISVGKYYYYRIVTYSQQYDSSISQPSLISQVYSHLPAKIISVRVQSPNSILVNFSDKIKTSGINSEVFKFSGGESANSVSAASEYSYLVTFNNSIPEGALLNISGLNDYYNSPIQDSSFILDIKYPSAVEEFFVEAFKIISPYNIGITFNKRPDEQSCLIFENYIFSPANQVNSVSIEEGNSISITTRNPVGSIGREYTLSLRNIYSDSGKAIINSGAGSYLLLSLTVQTLDKLYTYPNPVNTSRSNKLSFANITDDCEIRIYNINGEPIKYLAENDSNGGLDWDLNDENGKLVGSGIYIFKASSKKYNQEKLGKIAVVK